VLLGGVFAQAAENPVKAPPPYGTTDWAGLNWGVGLSVDFDIGQARVNSASVVNNIVRVDNTTSNASVGFVLEAHYFLRDFILRPRTSSDCTILIGCYTEVGFGPFAAIEIGNGTDVPTASSKGPVTGYALGVMVGLHHLGVAKDGSPAVNPDKKSWNFGIGVRVTPDTTVLGDGIVANQPLPVGESATTVRLKHEPRAGVMLLSSFSF
jgi:hypothetical protein